MALIACPDCGGSISDSALTCIHCGRPRDLTAIALGPGPAPVSARPRGDSAQSPLPLFPVATHKFLILSICSFTIYEFYWCYQNWKRIKVVTGEALSPFWRTFFAPFWGFSLFRRVWERAMCEGISVDWSPGVLATFYLALSLAWRLPDPWWWISFVSFVPMVPVQQAAQRVNDRYSPSEGRNETYTSANVATIVIGGFLLVLAIVGTFMPE